MCVCAYDNIWPAGETVNTSPSQGDIHGFEPRAGHQIDFLGHSLCPLFIIVAVAQLNRA